MHLTYVCDIYWCLLSLAVYIFQAYSEWATDQQKDISTFNTKRYDINTDMEKRYQWNR